MVVRSVLKKQFVCQRRNGGNCLSRREEFYSRESSSSPSMSKMRHDRTLYVSVCPLPRPSYLSSSLTRFRRTANRYLYVHERVTRPIEAGELANVSPASPRHREFLPFLRRSVYQSYVKPIINYLESCSYLGFR